jgi:Tol biopolymer transport system component
MTLDLKDTTQVTMGNSNLYVSPDWSPDGMYMIVSRSGGLGGPAKLQFHHIDGRSPIPMPGISPALKTIGAAFTPDGRYVYYAGRGGDWTYNAQLPQYQLYVYDRERGTSTLMTNRYGSAFRPAVSPDGKWLVYGSREGADTGLRMRELETGEEQWLIHPVQRDDQESRAPLDVLPGYSFTPDSKAIIISYGGEIWRVPMDKSAPSKIAFTADVKVDVGPEVKFAYRIDTATVATAKQIRNPVPSPDGKSIAFTAFDRLWVKSLATGQARRVSDADIGEYHASWSPDGKWLAYITWDDPNGGHIWKAPASGVGKPVKLTQVAALYYNLAWSPDSKRIVASRGPARDLKEAAGGGLGFGIGGEFVWVPAEGGAVTLIAPSGTRDVMHFRADEPNRIYAYSFIDGLVSFRWDGTDVKTHLRVIAPPAMPVGTPHDDEMNVLPRRIFPVTKAQLEAQEPMEGAPPGPQAGLVLIAPKGDWALAQSGNDIYAVMMPKVVGPAPMVNLAAVTAGPVPMRKLTDIGGEFPAWSADGTKVHWAIGNALVTYDLSRVKFIEDSTKAWVSAQKDTALIVKAKLDSLKLTRAKVDSLTKAKAPVPDSLKKRLNALRADSVQLRADSLLARVDTLQQRVGRHQGKSGFRADGAGHGQGRHDARLQAEGRTHTRDHAARHTTWYRGVARRSRVDDEGQGDHRERRRSHQGQPHRRSRQTRFGASPRRCARHRCERQDAGARVRRHALPRAVADSGDSPGAGVAVSHEPRFWRDDHA